MRRTYALVSLLIGIPCVWQPHIQAGDLSSHLYNAWLANQVSAGQLPGLYLAPQFTNVLFDYLLSFLLKHGGALLAERLAVLLAVEVFFWGCFRLASVAADRPAWTAAPFLAIAAYGAVFRMGFFNFYLAAGICAWAITLVWENKPRFRLFAIPLLALAYTAHPLGFLWAIGVIGYVLVARRLLPSQRIWLTAIGVVCIAGIALFIAINVPSRWSPGLLIDSTLGTDQVLTLFGEKYRFVEAALLCLSVLLLVRRFEMLPGTLEAPAFQLLVLNASACLFLPSSIRLPFYSAGLTYINLRLSLLSAIFFCAVIASVRMLALEKVATATLLVLFFWFTYADERAISSVERKMAQAVATLPAGTRVIATVRDERLYTPALHHLIDRACIGRCFNFANYEPSTGQFRLRSKPGNPYVLDNINDILDLENTEYVWRRPDIRVYRLQPCPDGSNICVSELQVGERLFGQPLVSVPK
jgi:hypothetical protein